MRKTIFFMILLWLAACLCCGASTYETVSRGWADFAHRVPGTAEYEQAANILEKALKDAGMDVRRQYFQTPVPEVTELYFSLNGKELSLKALMPNNAGLISTGDRPIRAEAVYIPSGRELPKVRTKGRIVLTDWGRGDWGDILFSEGAKAVIYVGDPSADQWACAKALHSSQTAFPSFYMERSTAEKAGILNGIPQKAVLSAQSRWKNVRGINLWILLPAKEEKKFVLNRPEALLLGARMDTFGMVPGACRGDRERENAALLAQCAVNLSKMPLPRSVFVLFYGGSFNAYDGIRNFLFPFAEARRTAFPSIRDYGLGEEAEFRHLQRLFEELPRFKPGSGSRSGIVLGIWHYSFAGILLVIYLLIVGAGYFREKEPVAGFLKRCAACRKTSCIAGGVILLAAILIPFALEKLFPGDMRKQAKESALAHELRTMVLGEVIRSYNADNHALSVLNRRIRHASGPEKEAMLLRKEQLTAQRLKIADLRRGIRENIFQESMAGELARMIQLARERLACRMRELKEERLTTQGWEKIAETAAPYTVTGSFFFDFSSDAEPFAAAVRGYENMHSFEIFDSSFYTKNFAVLKKIAGETPALQKSRSPLLLSALQGGAIPVNMTTNSLAHLPSSAGIVFRIPGWTFRNVPGKYRYDELPGTREYRLKGLAGPLTAFLAAAARAPEMSMNSMLPNSPRLDKYLNYCYRNGKYHGRQFYLLAPDGKEMDAPASGAVYYLGRSEYTRTLPVAGFSNAALALINTAGFVRMPGVTVGGISSWQVQSPKPLNSGALLYSPAGEVTYASTPTSSGYFKLFRCSGGAIPAYAAPLTTDYVGPLSLNNALTGNPFRQTLSFASAGGREAYFYTDQNAPVHAYVKNETFLLNLPENPEAEHGGILPAAENLRNLNVQEQALRDTLALNEGRLQALHRRNIFNGAIEKHHESAKHYREEAENARLVHDHELARAGEIFGQTLAVRAYRPLRQTIDDMIRSVLILLILTIPFAFAMERLFVCSSSIYRQIGSSFLFALGTFGVLYFTHPAFMLSQTPVVIFIAFFIILMSLSVIHIVMSRFQSEVQTMQSLNTSAHRIQSNNSTFFAALLVGVSGMRNRPVKTFLTIMTVVLLTFTIISFASFDQNASVRKVYFGDNSSEDRIEVFLGNHAEHDPGMMESVRKLYDRNYQVFFRTCSSISPAMKTDIWPLQTGYLYNPANQKFVKLDSVTGFQEEEKSRSSALRELVPNLKTVKKGETPAIFIADSLAKHLDLAVGDTVYLRSMKTVLGGTFPASRLDQFTFLDHGKVTGPNFADTVEQSGNSGDDDAGVNDSSHFIWNAPDMTVITDHDTALKLNGGIHAAVLYPRTGVEADLNGDAIRLAEGFYGMVYAGTADGVYKYFFGEIGSSSGLGQIVVPLLLGALIIFSSLLGSIADREKEIFTYSALGLSPFEVGTLFFAESAVYAVVGALGGYLLSQVTMSVLTMLAGYGLVQAPEMNYSSMSTVYTLLTVMAVVLLSTIYPAIKASRSATPDVARQWKMPPMQGDQLKFQFPFTVSAMDFGGILIFIGEFFRNHEDSSLGSFACSMQQVQEGVLTAKLALAPFDLGVSETLRMYSSPSEIEGIDVVTVEIRRDGGSDGNFMRANRRFVDEIRNQFLLWRTLSAESAAWYRSMADRNGEAG